MNAKSMTVSEFAQVYSGGTPSTATPHYWDGAVAWITPKDLSKHTGIYIERGERFITDQGLKESSACLVPADTVILSSRAPIGYVAVSRKPLATSQGCKNLNCRTGVAYPLFVYYLLRNNTQKLEAHATGSTYKEISASRLSSISFRLPDMTAQASIASVLSAYDDAVENNRRRIQLLEQKARLLYEEWFVRLRFPGHEQVSVTDGVPEGWTRKRLSDVCDTIGGGTPSTKVPEYWDGDVTWVVPSDVTRNDCLVLHDSERKITEKGLRESSAKIVPEGTILMTSRASVGFFALMNRETATNQGFINIMPHDEGLRMYLLFNLMSRVAEIRGNAKGTTYPEISKGRFRAMDIVLPENALMEKFSCIVSAVIQQVCYLKRSTLQLAEARDLLLPRLMNGEVGV